MFKRYRLENNDELEEVVRAYSDFGKNIMEKRSQAIKKELETYINDDGYIDMSKIAEDWFPTVECDIFLSHSHNDIELVNGLVGYLYINCKVNVFVDSYIWGYCNELLREIDNKYCKNSGENSYNYDKRNYSTSHVHMMLANSLNKIIDKCECIIFLDTENSLDVKEVIKNGTSSPWIYSELISTKLIGITIPERIGTEEKRAMVKNFGLTESFKPMYRGEVNHLKQLKIAELRSVATNNFETKEEYLDALYKIS